MTDFRKITPVELKDNTFKLIGNDWMLITAGNLDSYNTMTASWGGFGILWHKNICFCVIRPQRHTFKFIEKSSHFTLSFFNDEMKDALKYCGTHSGKDVDKALETGLTAISESRNKTVYFKEARLVIECKKIYTQKMDPKMFLDPSIDKNYPDKDYHKMFIGEITECLSKEPA